MGEKRSEGELEEYETKVEEAIHPRQKRRQRYRHREGRERRRTP